MVLVFCMLLRAHAGIYSPENRQTISADKYAAIVAIDKDPMSSMGAGCAGTFIAQDFILTAKHCPPSRFKLKTQQLKVFQQMVGAFDPIPSEEEWDGFLRPVENGGLHDFAIHRVVWFPGRKPEKIEVVPLSLVAPQVGQKVSIVGFPMDLEGYLMESYGEILAPYFDQAALHPNEVFVVYNCSQTSQNSGGPLLDSETSTILGIVSNSAAGGGLNPDDPDLQMHSRAVPTSVILNQSRRAFKIAQGQWSETMYQGSIVMEATNGMRSWGMMDVPVQVYKSSLNQLRVEFLNVSLPLRQIGNGVYVVVGAADMIFEIKTVDGKNVVQIHSWSKEVVDRILMFSPVHWFYRAYKTDKPMTPVPLRT